MLKYARTFQKHAPHAIHTNHGWKYCHDAGTTNRLVHSPQALPSLIHVENARSAMVSTI